MYQRLVLVGRLGRVPELRYFPDGTPVAKFSVAVNRRYTSREGERVTETTWFQVMAWGRLAEVCCANLGKGDLVMVAGRLRADPKTGGPRVYTRRDGTVGASFDVVAEDVRFLSMKEAVAKAAVEHDVDQDVEHDVVDVEEELPF